MSDSSDQKKFRGMEAFKKSFDFVFSNIPHLIQTSVFTLFAVTALNLAFGLFFFENFSENFSDMMSIDGEHPDAMMESMETIIQFYASPVLWGFLILTIVLSGMFAIRWHRSALFGADAEGTGVGFELSYSLFTYILRGFIIVLILLAALILGSLLTGAIVGISSSYSLVAGFILGVVSGLATLVACLYLFCRFSLALPAAALKIDGFGLRTSWSATKGYGFGIMGIYVLTTIVIVVATIIIGLLVDLALTPFFGTKPPMDMFDVLSDTQLRQEYFIRNGWSETLSSAILLPFAAGIGTSLFSYIYFQLGKPPVWANGDDDTSPQ